MSFEITLQKNVSEEHKVDKTITNLITLSGTLKEGTSIIDPVIFVAIDFSGVEVPNYVTIPAFSRSYFVRDVVCAKNNLWEISCHVDVISTWKESIRENRGIVHRQQSLFNTYLNDGSFRIYQDPIITTQLFPSGFNRNEFVLAVAGG